MMFYTSIMVMSFSFEMKSRTWAQFHYAVKMVKRNESIIRSTRMAGAIAQHDNRNLWREGR